MRIVNREEFLRLPAGTIFAKYADQKPGVVTLDSGKIAIKEETCHEDFVVQELDPWFEGCNDSGDWSDVYERMLEGERSPPVDYDFAGRDGEFDRDQLFLVWEKDDARKLIDRLEQAYASAYP